MNKHFQQRHVENEIDRRRLDSEWSNNNDFELPTITLIDRSTVEYKLYLAWLAGITEQINASLHPEFPGKWQNSKLKTKLCMLTL